MVSGSGVSGLAKYGLGAASSHAQSNKSVKKIRSAGPLGGLSIDEFYDMLYTKNDAYKKGMLFTTWRVSIFFLNHQFRLNFQSCPNVLLPDTLVYRFSQPFTHYSCQTEGEMSKRKRDKIKNADVFEEFTENVEASGIVATYLTLTQDDYGNDIGETEYFTKDQFQSFLNYRTKCNSGLLQKFVPSKGSRMRTYRVSYSKAFLQIEVKVNLNRSDDKRKPTVDRMVNFENIHHLTTDRAQATTRTLKQKIKAMCDSIVEHCKTVSGVVIQRMVLYLRLDPQDRLWLLFCSFLRSSSDGVFSKDDLSKPPMELKLSKAGSCLSDTKFLGSLRGLPEAVVRESNPPNYNACPCCQRQFQHKLSKLTIASMLKYYGLLNAPALTNPSDDELRSAVILANQRWNDRHDDMSRWDALPAVKNYILRDSIELRLLVNILERHHVDPKILEKLDDPCLSFEGPIVTHGGDYVVKLLHDLRCEFGAMLQVLRRIKQEQQFARNDSVWEEPSSTFITEQSMGRRSSYSSEEVLPPISPGRNINEDAGELWIKIDALLELTAKLEQALVIPYTLRQIFPTMAVDAFLSKCCSDPAWYFNAISLCDDCYLKITTRDPVGCDTLKTYLDEHKPLAESAPALPPPRGLDHWLNKQNHMFESGLLNLDPKLALKSAKHSAIKVSEKFDQQVWALPGNVQEVYEDYRNEKRVRDRMARFPSRAERKADESARITRKRDYLEGQTDLAEIGWKPGIVRQEYAPDYVIPTKKPSRPQSAVPHSVVPPIVPAKKFVRSQSADPRKRFQETAPLKPEQKLERPRSGSSTSSTLQSERVLFYSGKSLVCSQRPMSSSRIRPKSAGATAGMVRRSRPTTAHNNSRPATAGSRARPKSCGARPKSAAARPKSAIDSLAVKFALAKFNVGLDFQDDSKMIML